MARRVQKEKTVARIMQDALCYFVVVAWSRVARSKHEVIAKQ